MIKDFKEPLCVMCTRNYNRNNFVSQLGVTFIIKYYKRHTDTNISLCCTVCIHIFIRRIWIRFVLIRSRVLVNGLQAVYSVLIDS